MGRAGRAIQLTARRCHSKMHADPRWHPCRHEHDPGFAATRQSTKANDVRWTNRYHRWQIRRRLRQGRIPYRVWQAVVREALGPYRLSSQELHRLRLLTSLFLRDKVIHGAGGLELDARMRAVIAAQACLPILYLDLESYAGWREIIVYPDAFIVEREEEDEFGVVHQHRAEFGGESWSHGPVILSWEDIRPDRQQEDDCNNVLLHEFAHKLDMQDGAANGLPPLHAGMERQRWTAVFTEAYDDLHEQLARQHCVGIDPYGAEDPAEFFAVVSEMFFVCPVQLHSSHPAIYEQLAQYYRQDPQRRFMPHPAGQNQ